MQDNHNLKIKCLICEKHLSPTIVGYYRCVAYSHSSSLSYFRFPEIEKYSLKLSAGKLNCYIEGDKGTEFRIYDSEWRLLLSINHKDFLDPASEIDQLIIRSFLKKIINNINLI